MKKQTFTLQIMGEGNINKLESMGRKKGEYVSILIERDIKVDGIERRLKEAEEKLSILLP